MDFTIEWEQTEPVNHTEHKGERWKVRMLSSDSGKQTTQSSPPHCHPHKPLSIKSRGQQGVKAEVLTFSSNTRLLLVNTPGKEG